MVTCFDIGGSFIRYGQPQPDGSVPEKGRVAVSRDSWTEFVEKLRECTRGSEDGPIVISLAGAFDDETGLADVANIPCIHGRHVASDLSKELGQPVRIVNDANAFALAEAVDGKGKGNSVVFGIILGSGVGGGLVNKGDLITGHGGLAGEWGHGPIVDPTAGGQFSQIPHYKCGCGRTGCVDVTCSARGMERIHNSLHGISTTSLEITQGWHEGKEHSVQTVDVYTTLLSRALSMVVNLLGPDVIPVSGGLSADTKLLAEIDRKTRALALPTYDRQLVVRGTYADNGGLHGAGIIARRAFPEVCR